MAERQGFEPWDGLTRRWFSRPVLSTTQPPLQEAQDDTKIFTKFQYLGKNNPTFKQLLIN